MSVNKNKMTSVPRSQTAKIKVLYIGNFPIGMASTNRLISYSKGLNCEDGIIEVEIITHKSSENQSMPVKGYWNGVKYRYIYRVNNRFTVIKYVLGFFALFKFFLQVKRKEKVIFHATRKIDILLALALKILKKSKTIWLRDEKPIILESKIFRKIIQHAFIGYIFMTYEIKNYALSHGLKENQVFVLPVTIDFSRFSNYLNKTNEYGAYFCYVGLNNLKRDGFEIIIESFLQYKTSTKSSEILVCVGDNNNPELSSYLEGFKMHNYFSSIVFSGKKFGDELIHILANAKALITTPIVIQSLGFPIKLAEYLAAGKPVITTTAGEISYYLDETSAYLCKPGSISDVVNAFIDISLFPEKAKEIGSNGFNIAMKYFNIKSYRKDFWNFINKI